MASGQSKDTPDRHKTTADTRAGFRVGGGDMHVRGNRNKHDRKTKMLTEAVTACHYIRVIKLNKHG
jgi:hypothetical protein